MIPVDANTALQRHKWLAVAINKLRHKNSLPETSRNGFELEIPQQVADVAAGMCWALSPEEYEDLRMSTTEVLEFMEPDLRYEQHRFNSGILPKWIDFFFKAGPGRTVHPRQGPSFAHTGQCLLFIPQ